MPITRKTRKEKWMMGNPKVEGEGKKWKRGKCLLEGQ